MITDFDYVVDSSPAYIVTIVCLFVSLATLLPVFISFLRSPDLQRLPARLQFYTCIVNIVWSALSVITALIATAGYGIPCGFVGTVALYMVLASICWYAIIFYNLRKIVCEVPTTGRDELRYHALAWGLAAAACLAPFLIEVRAVSLGGRSAYDLAVYRTCFLQASQAPLRFGSLSVVAILVLAYMLYTSVWAVRYVRARNPHDADSIRQIRVRCGRYIVAFVLIWTVWVAEDIYLLARPDHANSIPTPLAVLKGLLFYSQGTINGVIYAANKWHHVRERLPRPAVAFVVEVVALLQCLVSGFLHVLCFFSSSGGKHTLPSTSSTLREPLTARIARPLRDLDDHPHLLDSTSVFSQDTDEFRSVAGELRGQSAAMARSPLVNGAGIADLPVTRSGTGTQFAADRSPPQAVPQPGSRRGYAINSRGSSVGSPMTSAAAAAKLRGVLVTHPPSPQRASKPFTPNAGTPRAGSPPIQSESSSVPAGSSLSTSLRAAAAAFWAGGERAAVVADGDGDVSKPLLFAGGASDAPADTDVRRSVVVVTPTRTPTAAAAGNAAASVRLSSSAAGSFHVSAAAAAGHGVAEQHAAARSDADGTAILDDAAPISHTVQIATYSPQSPPLVRGRNAAAAAQRAGPTAVTLLGDFDAVAVDAHSQDRASGSAPHLAAAAFPSPASTARMQPSRQRHATDESQWVGDVTGTMSEPPSEADDAAPAHHGYDSPAEARYPAQSRYVVLDDDGSVAGAARRGGRRNRPVNRGAGADRGGTASGYRSYATDNDEPSATEDDVTGAESMSEFEDRRSAVSRQNAYVVYDDD